MHRLAHSHRSPEDHRIISHRNEKHNETKGENIMHPEQSSRCIIEEECLTQSLSVVYIHLFLSK